MKILVIPDVQAKPGTCFAFLNKLGHYIVEKKPDKIICLGDFADMPSLSSYDVGKKSFEGRRYTEDIQASHDAMTSLLSPLWEFNRAAKDSKHRPYKPKMVMLYGNHENRVNRVVNDDPKLDGVLSLSDLNYKDFGWETVPFLDVHVEDGIAFSHYFVTGLAGRPAATANAQLAKKHMSCVAGHQQGLQIATAYKADGKQITSLIAGSCLAPHHKVLTADLKYVSLSEIKVGDNLVSFDEHLGMSAKRSRRFKTGTVTNIRTSVGELFDVTLSSGKVFKTTKDHRWLTNNCAGVRRWTETQNLRKGVNGTKINRLFEEWETDQTREGGWLAGMYDGEASLHNRKTTGGNCTQLAISQCPVKNPGVVEELLAIHKDKGFTLGKPANNGRNCKQWRITGGQPHVAKFLGSIRPDRMLSKFTPEMLGTMTSCSTKDLEYIVSVEPVGIGEYVEIEIDSSTMIVEGYPHHNCYEHTESYMSQQGNNHWRGFLMLHDVKDGEFDLMTVSLNYLNKKYS